MGSLSLSIERIEGLNPLLLVKDEAIKQKFIQIHDTLWGEGSGEIAYEREKRYFTAQLSDKEALQRATKFSIFTAFIDLAISGLSLQPGVRALCYLQNQRTKIGEYTDKSGQKRANYEDRLVLNISGYGELMMRQRAGQIRYADNPVVVYDNDDFSYTDREGRKSVDYTCHLPHDGHKIIACYIHIVRADGSNDYSVMFEDGWKRLEGFSAKNNKRWDRQANRFVEGEANALYSSNNGSIDIGFLQTKVIKHAFKSYPRPRVGKYTQFETQQEEVTDDMYGINDPAAEQPAMPPRPESFAEPADTTAGVTVDPSSNNEDDAF